MNQELMDAAWAKFDEAVESEAKRDVKRKTDDRLTDAQERMHEKLIVKKLDAAIELEAQALAA